MIWNYSKSYYEKESQERFERNVEKTLDHLQERMFIYENILRTGIGFFHGSDGVTWKEWHDFAGALDLAANSPGMQGFGYSKMIQAEEIESIEEEMRKNLPFFSLKPKSKRNIYSAILYLEPLDERNLEAIGYDMYSEPTRREAMDIARDTGSAAITKKVTLVQEIDEDLQAGILMYLPLYKKGAETSTIEQRRKALEGFVYSPFRMKDFMSKVEYQRNLLEIEIYDGEELETNHLLYSDFTSFAKSAKYQTLRPLHMNNLTWYIRFASTAQFDSSTESPYPLMITLAGLIINFTLLLIVLTLINSLQKLKEQTKKTKEQTSYMLHQSRKAQMGEMVSLIAHQWRQPLSSISTITGTLSIDVMMENYNQDFFSEKLNEIDNLAIHLSSTINDFRDFFKDKKQKEKATVQEIIAGTMQIIGSSLESKNIDLIYETEDEVYVHTYVNEIKQVLLNILKNAEDALMEKKGKNLKIWISWELKDNVVKLYIEDNAGGIPNHIIKNIFEPYFSTKGDEGTGLGLYMSKTIVEEHCQGKLSVKNTLTGARFTISLPYSEDLNSD
ncbi:CHASE domain-containing protein [Sulfurimonas sp. C5]|uniref:CHASE domain-containing protein n=1 Tax=Sulfurimonas sp. C5 TaxID=3036947 RepID=UPI002458E8E2|nr:CHASE domain-containing protein [Sulfurimonas sp. C5]MDH4944348.1 CHASE domain-containing protein [Sulfurimonas sp. C5]